MREREAPGRRGCAPGAPGRPRSGELRPEGGGHFAGLGKTTFLFLGEDDLAVQGDMEHASMPFDQLRFEPELGFDFVRQTGGSGEVTSGSTVFDDKSMVHPNSPFLRIIQGDADGSSASRPRRPGEGGGRKFVPRFQPKGARGAVHRYDGNTKISLRLNIRCVPTAKARQSSERKFAYPLDFWFRVSIISFQRSEKGAEAGRISVVGRGS